jgi:hypothetical protein
VLVPFRCWCHSGAGAIPVLVPFRCWCHSGAGAIPVLVLESITILFGILF